jgi:beta-glucosidase
MASFSCFKFSYLLEGNYAGTEIVQLYLRDYVASIVRPVKGIWFCYVPTNLIELKGFQNIYLSKGETRAVSFIIDINMLSFWADEFSFISEPGTFSIMIGIVIYYCYCYFNFLGSSSESISLQSDFELTQ